MDWRKEYRLSDLFRRGKAGEGPGPPPGAAPPPAEETASEMGVWKKEITVSGLFKRSKKEPAEAATAWPLFADVPEQRPLHPQWMLFADAPVRTDATPPGEAAASGSREAAAPEPEATAEPVAPAAAGPVAEEPGDESEALGEQSARGGPEQSIWRKEISVSDLLRRRKAEQPSFPVWRPPGAAAGEPSPEKEVREEAPPAAPLAPEAHAPGQSPVEESIWRKEIYVSDLLRRRREAAASFPVWKAAGPPDAHDVEGAGPAAGAPAEGPEPAAGVEAGEPVVESAPEAAAEPAPGAASEPELEGAAGLVCEPSVWKKEIRVSGLFRRKAKEPLPAVPAEGFAPFEEAPPPGEPVAETAAEAVPEPGVEAGEAVVEAGEAVVEPAPGAAPEHEVDEGAAEPVREPSVWKKEIRVSGLFRRKAKEPLPAVPPEGFAPFEEAPPPGEPVAETAAEAVPEPGVEAGEAVVEPAPEAAAEPAPEAAPGPELEGAAGLVREPSVWKKEIRVSGLFRGKAKEPAPAVPAGEPSTSGEEPDTAPSGEPPPLAEGAEEVTSEQPSVWKKEIRLSRRREPVRGPGRGGPERREGPARRDRPAEERTARSVARGSKGAGALPNVPLVRALNLLPREEAKTRPRRASLPTMTVAVLALAVLGGLSFVYVYERGRVADREGASEDLEAQVAAVEVPEPVEGSDGAALAGEALSRAGALSTALGDRIVWDRLMRDLSLILPDDVWLQSVVSGSQGTTTTDTTTGVVATTAGPSTVTITGHSLTQEALATFLARLGVLAELSSVQLQTATEVELGDSKVLEFSIAAALKPGGEATS